MAKASHVALRRGDLKVVAGVGLEVLNDGLLRPGVHLYVLMVILHLEDGSRLALSEQPLGNFECSHADVGLRLEQLFVGGGRDYISKGRLQYLQEDASFS